MKRIISVLMENAPGALSRIVGVFFTAWLQRRLSLCSPY